MLLGHRVLLARRRLTLHAPRPAKPAQALAPVVLYLSGSPPARAGSSMGAKRSTGLANQIVFVPCGACLDGRGRIPSPRETFSAQAQKANSIAPGSRIVCLVAIALRWLSPSAASARCRATTGLSASTWQSCPVSRPDARFRLQAAQAAAVWLRWHARGSGPVRPARR